MPLPSVVYLYPLNTEVLQITLQDQVTKLFLNNATVTATLVNFRGVADPVFNNIPLNYVNGTDGQYQGQVSSTFNPDKGGGYKLVITAVQAGVQAVYSIPVVVKLRTQQ